MAEQFDVVICGSGSAGLCAAVWLARYGIRCKILERMDGPLRIGQADGIQCRTVEIFEALGKSQELMREAYTIKEVCFWNPDRNGAITRTDRAADTPVTISHMPHLILNQARVNELFLQMMRDGNDQHVDYGYEVFDVQVDGTVANDPKAYPVTVKARKNGQEEVFQARYLFGSDGAHSQVRRSLGFKMVGDSTNKVWGVMDTWPRTTFPDIRKKCAIRSKAGNILIIPREGGSLTRFYIELDKGTDSKNVTREDLFESAKRIFSPYEIEFPDTFWWSAYSIGQRRADFFHKDYRAFLAGDACHTHSPKAGQGMNVSLQDGFNFGWKVASVLKGIAVPDLLKTYVLEREKIAQDLIDFDRYWTGLWSQHEKANPSEKSTDFPAAFKKAGDFMAGVMAQYQQSLITFDKQSHPKLAKTLNPGMRFPSAYVTRMSDANPVHLNAAMPADTRWRLLVFAGDMTHSPTKQKIKELANFLESDDSPIRKYTPNGTAIDGVIETLLILSGKRVDTEFTDLPDYYWPATGQWQLRDLNKVFFDDEAFFGYGIIHPKTYQFYQINPEEGALVILRPDGYVSAILPIDAHRAIQTFFDGFLSQPSARSRL